MSVVCSGGSHKKQFVLHCEIHPARRSCSANDRCRQGSKAQKSGYPFDQTLAFFERAAPPSPAGPQPRRARLPRPVQTAAGQFGAAGLGPLQAGAPAWLTPGPLRGPLQHQCIPLRTFEEPRSFLRDQRALTGDRTHLSRWLALNSDSVVHELAIVDLFVDHAQQRLPFGQTEVGFQTPLAHRLGNAIDHIRRDHHRRLAKLA